MKKVIVALLLVLCACGWAISATEVGPLERRIMQLEAAVEAQDRVNAQIVAILIQHEAAIKANQLQFHNKYNF